MRTITDSRYVAVAHSTIPYVKAAFAPLFTFSPRMPLL